MIDVYSWATPNGHKVHIMLEECELPYRVHGINIGAGDQFKPDFLKISPNNKIPAIVDQDGPDGKPISLFESGAILLYLAGKTGKFLPDDVRGKYEVLQWLMFQMGGVGPMLGQAHHFAVDPVHFGRAPGGQIVGHGRTCERVHGEHLAAQSRKHRIGRGKQAWNPRRRYRR